MSPITTYRSRPPHQASRLALLVAMAIISACSGGSGGDAGVAGPLPVASVTVSPTALTLTVGATQTLSASALASSGAALPGRQVAWSTSAPSVAGVSTGGAVTGLSAGSAVITATVEGKSASATVSVVGGANLGSLQVSILGAVPGAAPRIALTGPGGAQTVVTAAGPVAGLQAGVWTATIGSSGGAPIYPVLPVLSATVVAGQTAPLVVRYAPFPVTGSAVASLVAFDDSMVAFARNNNVPASQIAIMRAGRIVLARGYGWANQARTDPMTPGRPMRIASLTKPLTMAAIRQQVGAGAITYATRAIPYLGYTALPAGTAVDARFQNITVQHLLDHTAGFGASGSIPNARTVASALGIARLPTAAEDARWYMGTPLATAPGASYSYSNHGYLYLGLILERASGLDFVTYLKQRVITGAPPADLFLGKALPAERDPREPWYSDPSTSCSITNLVTCTVVPTPDGGIDWEAMHAFGGMVATPETYLRFMSNYGGDGVARPAGGGFSWIWYGSLPGNFSIARWYPDGTVMVALLNQRRATAAESTTDYQLLRDKLDAVFNTIGSWP